MNIYDCHIHSEFSIDGKDSIDKICETAIEKGLTAITITDHALPMPEGVTDYEHIFKCFDEVKKAREKYKDRLLVLAGVERDDEYPPEYCEPFYNLDLDCILGSTHSEPTFKEYFSDCGYKSLKYCAHIADFDFLRQVIEKYYFRVANMAYYADVDVITHITFPFRYINGYANRGMDIEGFSPNIDDVLDGIIKTGKSLELNTSGKAIAWNEFMPDKEILKRYYKLGGRNITLGSDAHKASNIAIAFDEAFVMLKELGFTHGSYFVKRKRCEYEL